MLEVCKKLFGDAVAQKVSSVVQGMDGGLNLDSAKAQSHLARTAKVLKLRA
jgi:chorismate synthase